MEKKYPINDQVSYGKDTLWGKCKTYKLRPLDGVLYCFGSPGEFLTIYDSAPGADNVEKNYPINDQVSYGKDSLWLKCSVYKLRPLNGNLYCFGSTGKFLTLYDSAPGAANMVGTFVWISPKLSEETSTKLFLLLKKYQVACGFSINDALRYRRVLVVDPKSDFSEADWNRLTGAGITVEPVHGSEEALASNLADLLS